MRILVVSDVRVVQEGLHSVLAQEDGVNIISTVDVRRATQESAQLSPDIVLIDAARLESVDIVRDLVAASPHTKIVAFGVKETDAGFLALATAGTSGCVGDSAASGDIVRVLEQVLGEELPCPPQLVATGLRPMGRLSEERSGSGQVYTVPLSRRELQIGQLIESGLTNKGIGRQLGIEAATVKNHLHNMCEKLKVHRRGEIAARMRTIFGARTTFPTSEWRGKAILEVG
jgi:two-component system nitrate/nitrite response regulator NarL